MFIKSLLALVALAAMAMADGGVDFGYPDNDWCEITEGACCGPRQSPVPLYTNESYATFFRKFQFSKKLTTGRLKGILSKTDHSVVFTPFGGPIVNSGGPLIGANYTLAQFHFHWGSSYDQGSEHSLNGKIYSAEVHFVHYKTEYESLEAALAEPDDEAVAVFGFFIRRAKRQRSKTHFFTFKKPLQRLNKRTRSFATLRTKKIFAVNSNVDRYYTYQGSLTTPSCTEKVRWVVFDTPLVISKREMTRLRRLFNRAGGYPLSNNYRSLQGLNGRTVFKNFQLNSAGENGPTPHPCEIPGANCIGDA